MRDSGDLVQVLAVEGRAGIAGAASARFTSPLRGSMASSRSPVAAHTAAVVADAVHVVAPAKGPYSRTISAGFAVAWRLSLRVLLLMAGSFRCVERTLRTWQRTGE
jgi:hypothetical protein